MKKRIPTLALVLILLTVSLTGCSKVSVSPTGSSVLPSQNGASASEKPSDKPSETPAAGGTDLQLPLVAEECTYFVDYCITADGVLREISGEKVSQIGIDTNVRSFSMRNQGKNDTLLYIKEDNTLWAVGNNTQGLLGDGTGVDRTEPVNILDDTAEVGVFSTTLRINEYNEYAYAIKTDKTLWVWGGNEFYEPVKIAENVVKYISAWDANAMKRALFLRGSGYIFDFETRKDLESDNKYGITMPVYDLTFSNLNNKSWIGEDGTIWDNGILMAGCEGAVKFKANSSVSQFGQVLAELTAKYLKSDNTLWGYGGNTFGQLGDGTKIKRDMPVKIADDVAEIGHSPYHLLNSIVTFSYLTTSGELWIWDSNNPTPHKTLDDVHCYLYSQDGGYGDGLNSRDVLLKNGQVVQFVSGAIAAENIRLPQTIKYSGSSAEVISTIPSEEELLEMKKVYFYDTYHQLGDDPSIMWGDLNWQGWADVKQSLTKESDGWYSFEMPTASITASYNMLIFWNGLPDSDPNSIQWVWSIDRGIPNGRFFVADDANAINPPESSFHGVQRDAASFATKEKAESALGIH